jgi:hypothetical protein
VTSNSSLGRPRANKLSPQDAELVRCAVRASTRYFGITIKGLDNGASWVAAAMRTGSAMTATTAERLFLLVQKPDKNLVGRKRPQGPSMGETQQSVDRHSADPDAYPLNQTPTLEYIHLIFTATRIIELYARPFPGSVFFVLPGAAQGVAESLADELADTEILGKIGRSRRRKLVEFLSFYFELGERPLKTETGRGVLGTLNALGVAYTRQTAAQINQALPEENVSDPMPAVNSLIEAEAAREKMLAGKWSKKVARKKRRVVMPRIRDDKL